VLLDNSSSSTKSQRQFNHTGKRTELLRLFQTNWLRLDSQLWTQESSRCGRLKESSSEVFKEAFSKLNKENTDVPKTNQWVPGRKLIMEKSMDLLNNSRLSMPMSIQKSQRRENLTKSSDSLLKDHSTLSAPSMTSTLSWLTTET
jgi:hypothetical protein